jgi:DNA-binding response OmpR family regulator
MNATKKSPAERARRIVVIEDDSDVAEMISKMLGRHGYVALVACDGVDAISKIMGGDIHMIILDIMMPFFSGYWYCDVFKRNPATKEIPVVIISALDKNSDIEKGLKLGADAYVTKPFTEEGLMQTIESVFARKQKRAKERTKK